ncbi:NAD+-dependent protein deacetylase SIR2 [Pancytospora philotis]|nr:NAD+-dependent protein deacetylase SIR2 [Pancytospora philotis]
MKNIDDRFIEANRHLFKHRKCVFVVGAGISVASGIPDFRSADGIFSMLRKQLRIDGKQLFTYNFGIKEGTREIYLKYIADLKKLCSESAPNSVHRFLAAYPRSRTYTQNIDCLEERAGMVFAQNGAAEDRSTRGGAPSDCELKGVYLHGNLKQLCCRYCGYKEPFTDEAVEVFARGEDILCKLCLERREACIKNNIRKRPIGNMHPGIIHYQQSHPDGAFIGKMAEKDRDCDLLVVMGTSLKVEGVKKLVKMFAKSPNAAGKRILVNLTRPTKEWEDVFDYIYEGDCGKFVEALRPSAPARDALPVTTGDASVHNTAYGNGASDAFGSPLMGSKRSSIEASMRRISISFIADEATPGVTKDTAQNDCARISRTDSVSSPHENPDDSFLSVDTYDHSLLKVEPSPSKTDILRRLEQLSEIFDSPDVIAQPVLDTVLRDAPAAEIAPMDDAACEDPSDAVPACDLEAEISNIIVEEVSRAKKVEIRLTPKKKIKRKAAKH